MAARARRAAGAWLLAATLVPAPAAVAQGLSPQVDPDSPAGVEYQLPLERAREAAAGVLPQDRRAKDDVPLFGVGVTQANPRTAGTAIDGATSKAKRQTRGRSRVGATTPAIVRAEAPAPGDSGSGLLAPGAAAAGVLLLGSLVGFGWRRRAMRH